MVWHPDQSGLPEGSRRFILSLRATGEGHISSITFRSGVIDAESRIRIDEPTRFVTAPGAGAERPLRQDPVPPQADRAGDQRPARPTRCWPRSATSSRSTSSSRTLRSVLQQQPAAAARVRADRPGDARRWPRPTTRSASRPSSTSRSGSSSRRRRPRPTASRTPGSSSSRRRRPVSLLRHLHGLRRPGDPAADARDRGLPPLPGQHAERAGGAEQGLRPLPAQGQRAVRDALAAGQREHLPDVLGHARTSGTPRS